MAASRLWPTAEAERRVELALAPANATVSSGVRVTMGCVSKQPARLCQWHFAAEKASKRHTLEPFEPRARKGLERTDCSLTLGAARTGHSGSWTCTLFPLEADNVVIVAEPAKLTVLGNTRHLELTTGRKVLTFNISSI
jgi:hypothetical protein